MVLYHWSAWGLGCGERRWLPSQIQVRQHVYGVALLECVCLHPAMPDNMSDRLVSCITRSGQADRGRHQGTREIEEGLPYLTQTIPLHAAAIVVSCTAGLSHLQHGKQTAGSCGVLLPEQSA